MRRATTIVAVLLLVLVTITSAQTRRAPARRAPAQPATTRQAADLTCQSPLGTGVTTKREFCDVMSGNDPGQGILVPLPPHRGDVTMTFELHNRHTYSEEQVKANRGYTRYTGVIGVLTMDNTLISRAIVQSEFRTERDLVDRVDGGAGPSGVKAVAPSGSESITITIPAAERCVSILGEKVTIDRADGTATYASPGRPIAVVSNVAIEYRPGPAPRGAAAKTPPCQPVPAR
jgi:hypothetical protein